MENTKLDMSTGGKLNYNSSTCMKKQSKETKQVKHHPRVRNKQKQLNLAGRQQKQTSYGEHKISHARRRKTKLQLKIPTRKTKQGNETSKAPSDTQQ